MPDEDDIVRGVLDADEEGSEEREHYYAVIEDALSDLEEQFTEAAITTGGHAQSLQSARDALAQLRDLDS